MQLIVAVVELMCYCEFTRLLGAHVLLWVHTTTSHLTVNSTTTEFLVIGLKQYQANLQDCLLSNITQSAGNVRFILYEHLALSNQVSALC